MNIIYILILFLFLFYIPGRNFRSNCRNYRRALLLFEMDVANPPSPVQIEAIGFSRSKAKNCFYLNEPLENMQKHRVFWVLLINYDNFSGKLTRIVHFCAKMCKKTCVFNLFWTIQYAYVYIYIVLSSVASPNPQGIDPRPGSWGEKKVLGSAGKHVFWGISWYFTGKMPLQYQLPFK